MAESRQRKQPQATDKLAFLLVLVPFLMENARVSVSEVAGHFAVTEERVREAVRLIAMSGIPGDTGTYQHGDLFDLDWAAFEDDDEIALTNHIAIDEAPRFSAREAAALIAGLQYLSSLPENANRAALASLTAKLSRGASATPSAVAVEGSASSDVLKVLRDAMAANRQLRFEYIDWKGDRGHRVVDPLRIESLDADWYLRAWDHTREAVRTFRADRIIDPVVAPDAVSARATEAALGESLFEGSHTDIPVTLDVAHAALPLIAGFAPSEPQPTADPDRVQVTLTVPHFHRLKRLVTGMPGVVRVEAPASARAAVRDWAQAALQRYDNDPHDTVNTDGVT